MAWWTWILLGCALMLLEIATPGGFYFVFFGVSALLLGGLVLIGIVDVDWVEWLLFSVFAVGTTALFRKPLLKRFGSHVAAAGEVDSLIGETATTMEGIQPGAMGKAELRGTAWSVCNAGADILVRGQRCRVERVDGLTLIIRSV